ncbi:spindle pole body component 110 [Malania oleifera]|uniref:spindle pole body component 110 n=1 Tax=Malania oleifera TaxID=397392 RepID=UPI0025AE7A69|nr:spindle pole body component 110 [Malania oleifera]
MGAKEGSRVSSDREKWEKIFNALVEMARTQQTQIESLVKDRKILEDRIKTQNERWVSDVRFFEDQISQMKRDFTTQDMTLALEVAKADFALGLKQREAFLYNLKLEEVYDELEDFKALFEFLSRKCSELEEGGGDGNLNTVKSTKKDERHAKKLEAEVERLRHECEELSSKDSAELSLLVSERNFVWNQLKTMESEYASQLKTKQDEIEQAKQKIEKLLANLEQLESSNNEKDETIVNLKAKVASMEAATNKKNEEISRISKKLDSLKKSRSVSVTPVLSRCKAELSKSRLGSKSTGTIRTNNPVKKELSEQLRFSGQGRRSLKRKEKDAIFIVETPKLFSSEFKVPKLKNASPFAV